MDTDKEGNLSEQLLGAPAAATVLHDGLPAPSAAAPASALGFGTVQGSVEGTGYTWSDTFFDQTDGVIAVFDYDYDAIESFNWSWTKYSWIYCAPMLPVLSLCCYPCFANNNIVWAARAQHVAVHRDGIKYVVDKRKAWCGLECSDKGKNSKTVPFDKLTDCDVQEPAGTACVCCLPNVLSTVTVDTASSGRDPNGQPVHELNLKGLKDPHSFKKCVWDCKRAAVNMSGAAAPDMDRGAEQTALLQGIRDELRAQTRLLEAQAAKAAEAGKAAEVVSNM